jgi:Arc/MetJ family transcription regulator
MRTTLDLDDTLIAELMKATKAKTKTDAIHLAMTDLIHRKKN